MRIKRIWDLFTDRYGNTVIHPQYLKRKLENLAILEAKKYAKGTVVDIGCGRMPYRNIIEPSVEKFIGVDHPSVSRLYHGKWKPDVFADAEHLPFPDNYADLVLILQAIGYFSSVQKALSEANRILKKSGYLIISESFLYPQYDIPYDKARYTDSGLRHYLKEANFEIRKVYKQGGFMEFWLLSLNVFMLKRLQDLISEKKNTETLFKIMFYMIVSPPIIIIANIFASVWARLSPAITDDRNYFPLNITVVAKRKNI